MNRRDILAGAFGLSIACPVARAAAQPFRVRLANGGHTQGIYRLGVVIDLDPAWKTYWRVPGDSGVPPRFDWTASRNLARAAERFPVPSRFRDEAGETIGYKDQVVLLADIEPQDAARPVALSLDLFLGVCKEICIPVSVGLKTELAPAGGADAELIASWTQRVPKRATAEADAPVSSARMATMADGRPALRLDLRRPVDDVFVEGGGAAYFHEPAALPGETAIVLAIDNLKEPAFLQGQRLLLTVRTDDQGVEQEIVVD